MVVCLLALHACDSASEKDYQTEALKKMHQKVQIIHQDLRNHCDSSLYADAWRMADSSIQKK